jgi:hypothetical protein|tara:strand:+ start:1541 stop:2122 length:582 start_codon:yes stop_codon:yes gene_type:complete
MAYSSIIIDDFYDNPDEVREFALAQDYGVEGNFPGNRTIPFLNDSTKNYIAQHITPLHGEITWVTEEYTGSFQYTTANDTSWMHADEYNNWAGVLYLTPNAPISGGTGLFKHKETGLYKIPRFADGSLDQKLVDKIYEDANDITKWEMTDFIGNKYNRLVIYQGDFFHKSLDYFGSNINNGRLFQTFFFDTKN